MKEIDKTLKNKPFSCKVVVLIETYLCEFIIKSLSKLLC